MFKNLEPYKIILASASPRRSELLESLGLQFEVCPADVKEEYPDTLGMTAIPVFLAEIKAESLLKASEANQLIIAADTIVWANGKVLGKPNTKEEAFAMLKTLSGNQHRVITGVSIQGKSIKRSFHAVTEVWFDELEDDEINYYIDKYKPMDKAGAYGIQEWIGYIGVKMIEGSFYNVMGMPVHKLYKELKEI